LLGPDATPEQRQAMREILAEVGVDFRSGPPSSEQREQIRKMMTDRGLPVADAAAPRPGENTVTNRTVYRLVGSGPTATLEAIPIKTGITDGSTTEVLEGLAEGDTLVTSIIVTGGSATQPRPATNPFGGGQRRF
jgi:HlyD family secretion protein